MSKYPGAELCVRTLAHLVHQATMQIPSIYTIRVCNEVSQSCVTVIPPCCSPRTLFLPDSSPSARAGVPTRGGPPAAAGPAPRGSAPAHRDPAAPLPCSAGEEELCQDETRSRADPGNVQLQSHLQLLLHNKFAFIRCNN